MSTLSSWAFILALAGIVITVLWIVAAWREVRTERAGDAYPDATRAARNLAARADDLDQPTPTERRIRRGALRETAAPEPTTWRPLPSRDGE